MDKKLKTQEPSWFKWWSWSWRKKGDNKAGTAKRGKLCHTSLCGPATLGLRRPPQGCFYALSWWVPPVCRCLTAWAFKPYPSTSSCAHTERIREPECSQPLMLARDSNHAAHVSTGLILLGLLSNHHKDRGQSVCVCVSVCVGVCVCAHVRARLHTCTHTLSQTISDHLLLPGASIP